MKRLLIAAALSLAFASHAQDALRPEVGKPLQAAREHLLAKRYKEALAKVREADAARDKTPDEQTTIERMRLSAALAGGDNDQAARAFEALAEAKKLPQADQLRLMESLAGGYYRAKDTSRALRWAERYIKEGGTSPGMRQLVQQAQVDAGDFASVARTVQAELAADEKAGRIPPEERLQLLAYSQQKLNDTPGYVATLEKLVTHHPKESYWSDLIARVQRKPGFSDRYALDIYRLKLATGTMRDSGDYTEAAQLAVQAGYPVEAKKIVEQGYASGALGKGAEAERHQRLSALVEKTLGADADSLAQQTSEASAARSGDALISAGFRHAMRGDAGKGAKLIEQGIAKGQLKRADEAQLRLGIAQLRAGRKADALKTLRGVKGADGSADIARLWVLGAGA